MSKPGDTTGNMILALFHAADTTVEIAAMADGVG